MALGLDELVALGLVLEVVLAIWLGLGSPFPSPDIVVWMCLKL